MKKSLILIIGLLLLLSGCAKPEVKVEVCKDQAFSYAANYLNNVVGYDASKEYKLECKIQDVNKSFPQLYHLTEDETVILSFVIADEGIGEANYMFNGKEIALSRVDNSFDDSGFTNKVLDSVINDSLYLEKVNSIDINASYGTTEEDKFDLIKQAVIASNLLYEFSVGDEITVYEHLNVITVTYDRDKNEIVSTDVSKYEYPIAVNGKIVGLVRVNSETYETIGAAWIEEEVADLIDREDKFIVSIGYGAMQQGICISANEDITITVPVILNKSYVELKKIAENQEVYKELLTFVFE